MRALIIANGQLPPRHLARSLAAAADVVVCADGGANHARSFDIRPDIILGDLDSISPSTKLRYNTVPLRLLADQESTDLEKAIRYCLRRRCGTIDIIGALGGRIDHATGSLGALKKFSRRAKLTFIDSVGSLMLIRRKRIRIETAVGQHLSLIPLEKSTGVTTGNLRYALNNETLELGVREGISNEATGTSVTISFRRGTLLVYLFHQRRGGTPPRKARQ